MNGRFPFGNDNRQNLRAALGLPTGIEEAYLLQQEQQRQQQQIQRELQLRQLVEQQRLEEQVSQDRQQLMAIKDQLGEYPDLQQHYQSMLLNGQLQRQRTNSIGAGLSSSGLGTTGLTSGALGNVGLTSANLLRLSGGFPLGLNAAQLQQHQREQDEKLKAEKEAAMIREQAELRAYEEQLIRKNRIRQELERMESRNAAAAFLATAVSPQTLPHDSMDVDNDSAMIHMEQQKRESFSSQMTAGGSKRAPLDNGSERKPPAKRQRRRSSFSSRSPPVADMDESFHSVESELHVNSPINALQKIAIAADMHLQQHTCTLADLLAAGEDRDQIDGAATVLVMNISKEKELPALPKTTAEDALELVSSSGLEVPTVPAESFHTKFFASDLPALPEEPTLPGMDLIKPLRVDPLSALAQRRHSLAKSEGGESTLSSSEKRAMAILEYPYPIDTWWPSTAGMRRERKQNGETSDEDNFRAPSSNGVFRANERKIRQRLRSDPEPGVLEKLPHCRIHRVRTKKKKNSTAPELVFCWQVTEIYPRELMVCCSVCGTWRHAACGGHHKPYSVNANTKEAFEAVCENCHEEKQYLDEYPAGANRLDRQRVEQLRRAMATSSVIRHFSYSKHGGTYKWPLGSVSATHITGHTRSILARHDKAEKQWADMNNRLSRGRDGYRPKERVRSRTKELERLLSSIEDAEGYTDRHNMNLFLRRDIAREKPTGFEGEFRNIFDPSEDDTSERLYANSQPDLVENAHNGQPPSPTSVQVGTCIRSGCERKQRFDSRFCSDACGVACLEKDLLDTLEDACEMHPSILRAAI